MDKTKRKIALFVFLSAIGLVAGFFFAGYVDLLLSGGNTGDIGALRPDLLWKSTVIDERHRLLTLCTEFMIVAGIAALMLMGRRETFESDTTTIAGEIGTPVAVGQGQHGSARWLKPAERKKAFGLYRLDAEEPIFAALLEAGARDRKEVKDRAEEPFDKRVAAPDAETVADEPPGAGE
jgi:type IV secretion system protein VirD4